MRRTKSQLPLKLILFFEEHDVDLQKMNFDKLEALLRIKTSGVPMSQLKNHAYHEKIALLEIAMNLLSLEIIDSRSLQRCHYTPDEIAQRALTVSTYSTFQPQPARDLIEAIRNDGHEHIFPS